MAAAARQTPAAALIQQQTHEQKHAAIAPPGYLLNLVIAGSCSGTVEGTLMQPLELLKTRLQINEGRTIGMGTALRQVLQEGGVRQLFRGGLPEIVGMLPRSTAALASLDMSKRALASTSADGKLRAEHAYLAGAVSGVAESLGFAPFQVIKVRMAAVEHVHRYSNSLDCARQIVQQEGALALLNGLGPTLWRVVTWNSIYYGTMHQLQVNYLDHHRLGNGVLEAARKVGFGIGVGVFATLFNSPFDVVKSRVQAQLPGDIKYRYTLPSLVTIVREEGFAALYKGFSAKALRLGLGQTIGYLVFTETLQRLSD